MENGEDIIKIICYLLQYIGRARFVESSLSNLVNVFPGGIHKIKCMLHVVLNMQILSII